MEILKFKNEKSAVINLDEIQTNEIPHEIGELTTIEKLIIQPTKTNGNWSVYPALSWYENREIKPPYRFIPVEIGQLKALKSLSLVNLDIKELPETLIHLQSLEFLNVSLNKLELENELPKFRVLKKLKHLMVLGNHYNELEMQKFKAEFPSLNFEYKGEEQ
ncbi:MAG: hypothetical protein KTR26_19920 [Flammeovirgaceae bacterium]|nr:hypothetical protein [Flammeovirgaceae bacterium]